MVKKFNLLLLLGYTAFANAQPGKSLKKLPAADPFADSIQLIIKNSGNGFLNFRYNEQQRSVSLTYNTTLPFLGFEKRYVQVGQVTPYKKLVAVTLPYFIATKNFNDSVEAKKFLSEIKRKIVSQVKPFAQDSTARAGITRYNSFQLSKPLKDSFVTIELPLLSDPKSCTVILRLFNSKGSTEKGVMKDPPIAINTNKNHFTEIVPLIEALMTHSKNNFTAARSTLLQNERWKPTYLSIISFRDFSISKIEYVTHNLWNQYTTNIFIKDKAVAEKRFQELIGEIEINKPSFPTQRFETRSTDNEKWWYYDKQLQDVEGKNYKNTLRISLEKALFVDGYYLTFEFRKSVG